MASILLLALFLLSAISGFSILIPRRYVIVPLTHLATSAVRIVNGDLSETHEPVIPKTSTNDEIGVLTSAFTQMAVYLQNNDVADQTSFVGAECLDYRRASRVAM